MVLVAVYAPAPNTERGKQTRLTTGPQGDKIVYASGNSIIIRSIVDPMDVDIYTRHKSKTTVGRISPSGYYCASAGLLFYFFFLCRNFVLFC